MTKISKLFKKEKIVLQHKVLDYYIDLNFIEYKLAVEIDERGQLDRKEQERENKIKQTLGCEFVRINPDKKKLMFFTRLAGYMITLMKLKKKVKMN